MRLDKLEEIYKRLINGKITHQETKDLLFDGKKSWHEKDWKERKERFLKSSCEQCGKTEDLVVQHLWHPEKYGEYKYSSTVKYGNIFDDKVPIEKLVPYKDVVKTIKTLPYRKKERCPKCGATFRYRRTMVPAYICNKCKNEFETPSLVRDPTYVDDIKQNIDSTKTYKIRYSRVRYKIYKSRKKELLEKNYGNEIEYDALINYIKDNMRYLKFEGAVTWCSTCAFNYDKNDADLCPKCKKNYKIRRFKTCKECAGIKEKKEAERICGTCMFAMYDFEKSKTVCAGGNEHGPYKYGEEITDENKYCENWELAFSLSMDDYA